MKKNFFTLALLLSTGLGLHAQQLAFPGAEGYGAYATGGRGGTVVHVTNLNASGAGSLADAVSKPNRIVVFDVGGVIDVTNANLTIASNVTIAGQTAPGEGITIYGGRVIASGNSNIIIRYIRMRGSIAMDRSKCTLTLDNCNNVILDHCSISWGRWDNVHIKDATNITWQNCIISEGIDPQRFGSITDGTTNWTVAHCLWADNKSRNPKMKCNLQYYNNVVYNYGMAIIGGHSAADHYQDVINNYFITGPNSGSSNKYFDQWTSTDHLYSTGNYTDGNNDGKLNGTLITDYNGATPMTQPNFKTTHPMNLKTAEEAYYDIVEHVGASRVRDSHDQRIIDQLTSLGKKGAFIDDESGVGGIGTLSGGSALKDTDGDGMPDEWEDANGTDKNKNDANVDSNGDGYTNIETYINSLARKSDYLMPPTKVKANVTDDTSVTLSWTNSDDEIENTLIEQSEDGNNYQQIAKVGKGVTSYIVNGLTPKQVYFFRLKVTKGEKESTYSDVVSINNEYMKPNGGTDKNTKTFVANDKKYYRIINYATKAYNSGTTLAGTAKYLTFAANGALIATEDFEWDNPALLWDIQEVKDEPGSFTLKNKGTGQYFTAVNIPIGSENKIGAADTASVFNIVYTGNGIAAQSGKGDSISLFRINSPSNNNQQIRAKNFVDTWIWGSGTLDRSDMVFTFTEVDKALVRLYLKQLNASISDADQLLNTALIGNVTLGYPATAHQELVKVIDGAKDFQALASANGDQYTQAEVDSVVTVVKTAISNFKKTQIMTWAGYETDSRYVIYSYGTMSNASATTADASIGRRYLTTIKKDDNVTDSLIFKVGPSDADLDKGVANPISESEAAQWTVSEATNGMVYLKNVATGSYLQIGSLLSSTPVSVYPYYAADDNGKHAFYIETSDTVNRCLNVGTPDADGLQGSMSTAYPANRTRLRWIFEEVDFTPTAINNSLNANVQPVMVRYYNLQGMEISHPKSQKIYIEKRNMSNGEVISRVVVNK